VSTTTAWSVPLCALPLCSAVAVRCTLSPHCDHSSLTPRLLLVRVCVWRRSPHPHQACDRGPYQGAAARPVCRRGCGHADAPRRRQLCLLALRPQRCGVEVRWCDVAPHVPACVCAAAALVLLCLRVCMYDVRVRVRAHAGNRCGMLWAPRRSSAPSTSRCRCRCRARWRRRLRRCRRCGSPRARSSAVLSRTLSWMNTRPARCSRCCISTTPPR
jgi:hypothetical protein